MKRNHDKFMTEKEKNYVASNLARNVLRPPRHLDYSIFFRYSCENYHVQKYKRSETPKNKELQEKREQHRQKMRVLLETSLHRTEKKSKKIPRLVGPKSTKKLSEKLESYLKIEQLFYKVICLQKNILIKLIDKETLANIPEHECSYLQDENTVCADCDKLNSDMVDFSLFKMSELDFIDCMTIPKFFQALTGVFQNVHDEKVKLEYMRFLLQYSARIPHSLEYIRMIERSQNHIPRPSVKIICETDFFKNFYFNICNVSLAKALLSKFSDLSNVFYKNLCNENLDLLFSLENDRLSWEFVSVFVNLLDDTKKSILVDHIKEKIVETLLGKDEEKISALNIFLDSIGIDHIDTSN